MTTTNTGTAVTAPKKQSLEDVLMVQADDENRVLAYQLAKQVERQGMLRKAASEMAKLSWGKQLSDATRAAITRWALENDIDPLRHFDVLGNNLYANARYYYDRVANDGQLVDSEVVMMAPLVSVDFSKMPVSDKQKEALKAEAQTINAQRLSLQMKHGVPEAINSGGQKAAAVLIRLYWRDGSTTEGINWAGAYGGKKDPVGEEHPTKTAITRAFRKAAITKVSVHQFCKDGEDAPAYTVGQYIEADREERHNQPELPPQASYVKPIDVPQLPAQAATEFQPIEGYPADDDAGALAEDLELTGE